MAAREGLSRGARHGAARRARRRAARRCASTASTGTGAARAATERTAHVGMAVFLGSWAMLFVALFFAYAFVRGARARRGRRSTRRRCRALLPGLNTLVIAASSVAVVRAVRAQELGARARPRPRAPRARPRCSARSFLALQVARLDRPLARRARPERRPVPVGLLRVHRVPRPPRARRPRGARVARAPRALARPRRPAPTCGSGAGTGTSSARLWVGALRDRLSWREAEVGHDANALLLLALRRSPPARGTAAGVRRAAEARREGGRRPTCSPRASAAYVQYCRACHGDKGDGKGPAAQGLRPPPRDFTLGVVQVRRGPGGRAARTTRTSTASSGAACTGPPCWRGTASRSTRSSEIIQYVKTFSPRWKEEEPGRARSRRRRTRGRAARRRASRAAGRSTTGSRSASPATRRTRSKAYIYAATKELTGTGDADFREDMYGPVLTESDFGVKLLPPDFTFRAPLRSGDGAPPGGPVPRDRLGRRGDRDADLAGLAARGGHLGDGPLRGLARRAEGDRARRGSWREANLAADAQLEAAGGGRARR